MVMTDHITGLVAAQSIGFALFRREKTGQGEAIEVPMFETMASFVTSEHLGAATFDPPEGPTGDARLLSADYRPLPTLDGYITVRPNDNRQAFAFFDAIGRPELKSEPRFATAISRTQNAADYFTVQVEALAQKTTAEWLEILAAADVPAARYNTIDDLLEDPHLGDVGFWNFDEHPTEGRIRRTRTPVTFGGGMREEVLPAPRLGAQTRDILAEAGYAAAEIDTMLQSGAAA
jgi:crotonobetainyl-CoA:carnitine CoA-transferase CaiB-like acyl-CoA transferase